MKLISQSTAGLLLLLAASLIALQAGESLPLADQIGLLDQLWHGVATNLNYNAILFVEGRIPRLLMAMLVGSVLGLVGSLMQQLTQNPLVSPLTLGTASGAWLALVAGSLWFPVLAAQFAAPLAMTGAMLALALTVFIAGLSNLSGLPMVLAGLAVNILFGSIATAMILLNDQYARDLFIWGAGDLEQNGWQLLHWLLPNLLPALLIPAIAPRVLMLLRLGQDNAAARGLTLLPLFLLLLCLGLWSLSAAIAAVGVISFVGLLAPNIARRLGARLPLQELLFSSLLGALLLIATDALAILITELSVNLVPTGVATALIGAPALIYFSRSRLKAKDNLHLELPLSRFRYSLYTPLLLVALLIALLLLTTLLTVETAQLSDWRLQWPSDYSWSLRWPRMLVAIAAGGGTAVAGVLLQRLIYNPLASPDVIGVSAGATLALVAASLFFGINIHQAGPWLAFLGSAIALVMLIALAKRQHFAPSVVVLIGISMTAMIEALVHFAMARADESAFAILAWLAGSTYRVSAQSSVLLAVAVTVIVALVFMLQRWLVLISAGRVFAQARGLSVGYAFATLLGCVALLVALVTSLMGPVAFVGLLAPHIGVMLGARKASQQLLVALLTGANLMLFADLLGQYIVYPAQIAAGIIVAVLGGAYFIFLLIRTRMKS
ncbi:Fe(3+)-hydroxamate ABC transporter permease FhuB [Reinekea marinisedimentorum]|uniref:Iron complex transport system permease protein n=1 Tax=Reinekea marinisedimentorum TaxID=230495 RepID=A0A4R3HUG1_9GAMM|nr:Fe(3+)-hydroxamate ABC transporter permease FhuB [Reinekea marinisedimentorum]TCS36742.1 iron complex transport system permease protein [Reinekea marinisedimentorum]